MEPAEWWSQHSYTDSSYERKFLFHNRSHKILVIEPHLPRFDHVLIQNQSLWPKGLSNPIGQAWVMWPPLEGAGAVRPTQTIWTENKEGQVPQEKNRVLFVNQNSEGMDAGNVKTTCTYFNILNLIGFWGYYLETEVRGLTTELPVLFCRTPDSSLLWILFVLLLFS